MSAHTPGPWKVEPRKNYNDNQDCEVLVISSGEYFVCEILSDKTIAEDDKANARLIAAAPELLAVCQAALLRDDVADDVLGDKIRAAVAKAEGK